MKKILLASAIFWMFGCSHTYTGEPSPYRGPSSERAAGHQANPNELLSTHHSGRDAKLNKDGYEGKGMVKNRGRSNIIKHVSPKVGRPDLKEIKFMSRLSGHRGSLMENNLFDTGVAPGDMSDCAERVGSGNDRVRSADGTCYFYELEETKIAKQFSKSLKNDGDKYNIKNVGAVGTRFGRNVSHGVSNAAYEASHADLMSPNPREISKRLFTRIPNDGNDKSNPASADGTVKAPIVNLWAAAWLQAMNHDWFTHGKNRKGDNHKIPGVKGDREFARGMKVPKTRSETDSEKAEMSEVKGSDEYTYNSRNMITHWWDAGQIYGNSQEIINKVRCVHTKWKDGKCSETLSGGKILVNEKTKRLYYDENNLPITGFHDNWWVGLDLIHSLFAMEHNYVAGKLAATKEGRKKGDDWVFNKARLVISALMAKIHTVEWTPAILDNETLHVAMRANWYGLKEGELLSNPAKWMIKAAGLQGTLNEKGLLDSLNGLAVGSVLEMNGVPFTLTEEFTAVYRMHPLIPENIDLRSTKNTKKIWGYLDPKETIFQKAAGNFTSNFNRGENSHRNAYVDLGLSFGTSHPGLLVLRNHPTFMQNIKAERNTGSTNDASNTSHFDLAAVDILRDRARGVPRYNAFRSALGLKPADDFHELVVGYNEQAVKEKEIEVDSYKQKLIKDLDEVYGGDINKVDLLVGCMGEADRYAGYGFGNTSFFLFALMASRRLKVDPYFSELYNKKVYTKVGYDHLEGKKTLNGKKVKGTHFIHVLKRHYPELEAKGIFKGIINGFRPWNPTYKKVKAAVNNG